MPNRADVYSNLFALSGHSYVLGGIEASLRRSRTTIWSLDFARSILLDASRLLCSGGRARGWKSRAVDAG